MTFAFCPTCSGQLEHFSDCPNCREIAAAIRIAVAEEREACANIAWETDAGENANNAAIVAAIRARNALDTPTQT